MTGRRLYEKYTDALGETKTQRWDGDRYVLRYPLKAPLAWRFITDGERNTWNTLARKLSPRPRKAPA